MEIDKAKLLSSLKLCRPGIGSATSLGIEGMHCFVFKNNRIYAHNDYISISVAFPSDLNIAIDATEFFDLIRSLPGTITLEQKDNILIVKSGKATSKMSGQSEEVFRRTLSILPEVPEWKKLPENFNHYMSVCNSKGIQEVKAGVYAEGNNILSYTEHILNWVQVEEKLDRMWLSTKVVNVLEKCPDFTHYQTTHTWIHFMNNDMTFSCRGNIVDNYDPQEVYNLIQKQEMTGPNGELTAGGLEAIKRACIFEDISVGHPCIDLQFTKNNMTIHAKNTGGESSDDLVVQYEGEPFTVRVDGHKILGALKDEEPFEFGVGFVKGKPCSLVCRKGTWTVLFCVYEEKKNEG